MKGQGSISSPTSASQEIHVGTSGWNYPCFVGSLYPPHTPQRRYLEAYAERLGTVELNASFYRSFPRKTWQDWHQRTPSGFLWAVKAPRYITHIRRLEVSGDSVDRFWNDVSPLEEKFAAALYQLPPNLVLDADLLQRFLQLQPPERKIAIEARHPSWHQEAVWDALRAKNMAWVVSDTAGRYPMSLKVTADFAYVRLHGPKQLYRGAYGESGLRKWLDTIRGFGVETFIYFDNTDDGSAARDALLMAKIIGTEKGKA